jgi:hypothetical protein
VTRAGAAWDALAEFQLAAMNIAQALSYTQIGGMPINYGVLHAGGFSEERIKKTN